MEDGGVVSEEWTFSEVTTANMEWREHNPDAPDNHSPYMQWVVLRELLPKLREQYLASNDAFPLMNAIALCARHRLTIPQWAANGFLSGFDRVGAGDVASWDAAWGLPYPKGVRAKRVRQHIANIDRAKKIHAYVQALRASNPSLPIDRSRFEKVAKKLRITRRRCEELYYWRKARLRAFARGFPASP
jgi:hypothetical protein